MAIEDFNKEIEAGKRFEFGENWKGFLSSISEEKIREAEESLQEIFEIDSFAGKTFLDAGSGSGLFSLAAKKLGAARVYSLDFDPAAVWCARELKTTYFESDADWIIAEGSVLDSDHMKSLGLFDYVYSWGVPHHTGSMWLALHNLSLLVKKGGYICTALYNRQPLASKYWQVVKRIYNRWKMIRPVVIFIHLIYPTLPSLAINKIKGRKISRGMSYWYDLLDWLGGYPFEVSSPKEVFDFFKSRGFSMFQLKTVGGKLGCNEYVFERLSNPAVEEIKEGRLC